MQSQERLWCRARSASTGSPKKVPETVPGGFGGKPGQVQQGSEEGSGEGLGGFDAEPGQVQKVWEAFLEKVPEKVPGSFDAEPGQVQQGSGEGSGEGLGGFGVEPGQVQQVFPALGFAARFRKICKH